MAILAKRVLLPFRFENGAVTFLGDRSSHSTILVQRSTYSWESEPVSDESICDESPYSGTEIGEWNEGEKHEHCAQEGGQEREQGEDEAVGTHR